MTESPAPDSHYIGICSSMNAVPPETPSAYTWTRFTGEDAASSYIHIRYSGDGNQMTAAPEEGTMYLGICISEDSTAPEDMSAYQWCRISYGKEVEGLQQTAGELQQTTGELRQEIEELKNEIEGLKKTESQEEPKAEEQAGE